MAFATRQLKKFWGRFGVQTPIQGNPIPRYPWNYSLFCIASIGPAAHKWSVFCCLSEELSSGHRRKFCDFPVNFPVCREMQQESGSL